MDSQKLDQAVKLIKSGNKQAAFPLLKDLIREEPNNEQVWLWMFTCVDKPEQKKYCLQKALEINPNNADARKAFDRLSGKESPSSSVQPAQSQSQQQPVHTKLPAAPPREKPLPQTAMKKQPVASRNRLLIGGLIVVILLCSSVGIGGYWVYGNYLANEPQAFPSGDNNPMSAGGDPANPNQNTDIDENSFPTPVIVEPGNGTTPTATVDGVYDVRITPISYTKAVNENDPQWSTLEVTLAIENYSHEFISGSHNGTIKIKTQQGFEYECQRNIRIGTVPSNFRKKIVIYCSHVPTDSSGYNIYGTIDIRKSDANAYSGHASSFEVNIENINTGLSFPLIDRNYYSQQNLPLYSSNQEIDLTDIIISFSPPIYSEEDNGGIIINYAVQNKIAGDEIMVSIVGNLFFKDGNSTLLCLGEGDDGGGYLSVDINSTSSARLLCGSMDTISSPLDSSCLAITDLGIKYSNSTKEEKIIRNLIVCF